MAAAMTGTAHFRAAAQHIAAFMKEHPNLCRDSIGLLHGWLHEPTKVESLCQTLDILIWAQGKDVQDNKAAGYTATVIPFNDAARKSRKAVK